MKLQTHACALLAFLSSFICVAGAQNCSNLPTQFTGNEFPTGDFFSNFQNSCYLIPLPRSGASTTDIYDTDWQVFYKVDPRYQLIVVGSYPNARYFSLTAYDDHYLTSQPILDANIVPLTSSYVNPYRPGVPYASGQQYAVPINFGGTPGTLETGCMMNGYNVDVNALDGSLRHQGMNWNTDPGVFQQIPATPLHVVDTPQHTNPPATGYLLVRAYVDINQTDPLTTPSVIVRDVASGCAYPAAYAQQTLQIVTTSTNPTTWLNQPQLQAHQSYDTNYLPSYCYGTDPQNAVSWSRDGEFMKFPNPYGTYINAALPANTPATLAAAGEVMRIRLRLPVTPPTPCTNGCSRSGTEQMRYSSLSFYGGGPTLTSIKDSDFTKDSNGYATLIVGTGAGIPSWIAPANGYTFLDLTAISGYQNLSSIQMRNILASGAFACSAQNVPYKTGVYTPQGGMMGDYLPVVDYPLAATLPPVASEVVGPGVCGTLPVGLPGISPNCGLLASNPTNIASIPAPAQAQAAVSVQPLPPITLSGAGFGLLPNGLSFTGNSPYLQVTDITQGWSAGYTANPCNVSVGYWEDNRIELVANVNQNGLCPLAAGDQLAVSVWNPQTLTPASTNITVGSGVYYALGTSSTLVGGAAGSGTVPLIAAGPWSATSNATWLHLSTVSAAGAGNALIQFSYDANLSPNIQTGTLTIAGLTFTVTQAGAGYAPVTQATVLASELNLPQGVAVDAQGNVYIADMGNNAIQQWNAATQQMAPLVSSGLSNPTGVALDAQGNVYIADSGNHAIERWSSANPQLTVLASGLGNPYGVAVDAQGDVYFSDSGNNTLDKWSAASPQAITLDGSLSNPAGVGVDALGNIYFANTGGNAIAEWNVVTQQATTPVSSGLNAPTGVAVDLQGNIYLADTGNKAIKQWNAATQQVLTLVSSGLSSPTGIAVDTAGNLYVADQIDNSIRKITFAYLSLSTVNLTEGSPAGTGSVTAQTLPSNLTLTASSDQPWLAITGATGGVIGFTFQANTSGAGRVAHINVLGQQVTVTQTADAVANVAKSAGDGQSTPAGLLFTAPLQVTVTDSNGLPVQGALVTFTGAPGSTGAAGTLSSTPPMPVSADRNGIATAPALTANNTGGQFTVTATVSGLSVTFTLTNLIYTLGTSGATVGSAAGSGSVVLTAAGPWTAVGNASWLTVSPGSTSGAGNAAIDFSYAENTGASPQTGTLTISGLTFTVTQAGVAYTPVSQVTALVASGLNAPRGVALDAQGNVYIADTSNNAIREWTPGAQQVSTLVSSGLNTPTGVAVDSHRNVYIADSKNNALEEWSASTRQVTALVSSGLDNPMALAVDSQGNVYFSDTGHNSVKEWNAVSHAITTLAQSLNGPRGLAVDALGNVFFADNKNNAVKEWNAATSQVTSLVSSGLKGPYGVALDGADNVYFADGGNNAVKQWNAVTHQVASLVATGLNSPSGLAVDSQGSVYIADTNNNAIKKLTSAYLSLGAASRNEGATSGTDSVSYQILPAGAPLAAASDQSWLTITGTANGAIGFSFKANTSANSRTAHITTWGLQIAVVQSGDTPAAMSKAAGAGQSTPPSQAFPIALQVRVKDASGTVVKGAPVTFTAVPASNGATGTFASSPPMPILTDSSGLATAPTLTANATAGTFKVSASTGSLTVTFSLTIAAP